MSRFGPEHAPGHRKIGPTNKEDLAMIAKAVGSESLQRDIDDVWNAILSIRSSHISAGNGISALLREELVDRERHIV